MCDEQLVVAAAVAVAVAVAAEELQEELQEQPVVAQVLAAQRCLAEEMAVAGDGCLEGSAGASGERSSSHRSCEPQRSRC